MKHIKSNPLSITLFIIPSIWAFGRESREREMGGGGLISLSSSSSLTIASPSSSNNHFNRFNKSSSFINFRPSNPNPNPKSVVVLKRQSTTMTVSFSLPTSKPDGFSADKLPKWSARAIKSFAMGELEARKLKYPNTGTEALLMGILVEGTSQAAKFLRDNGITLFKVRDETVNLLGKSDMYFFSPEHPPLTEPAQKALDWAIEQKLNSGEDGEITVTHLLAGIWAQEGSAAYQIMTSLGFNNEKGKELSKYMDKDIVLSHK